MITQMEGSSVRVFTMFPSFPPPPQISEAGLPQKGMQDNGQESILHIQSEILVLVKFQIRRNNPKYIHLFCLIHLPAWRQRSRHKDLLIDCFVKTEHFLNLNREYFKILKTSFMCSMIQCRKKALSPAD